jgi:hypothetical protein
VASQELYGKWSTVMVIIHPYSFMETRDLSIELFDGDDK